MSTLETMPRRRSIFSPRREKEVVTTHTHHDPKEPGWPSYVGWSILGMILGFVIAMVVAAIVIFIVMMLRDPDGPYPAAILWWVAFVGALAGIGLGYARAAKRHKAWQDRVGVSTDFHTESATVVDDTPWRFDDESSTTTTTTTHA